MEGYQTVSVRRIVLKAVTHSRLMRVDFLSYFALCCFFSKSFCDKHEKRLYNDLLKNYSYLERPVINNSLPVVVSLQVILQQIVDVVSVIECLTNEVFKSWKIND